LMSKPSLNSSLNDLNTEHGAPNTDEDRQCSASVGDRCSVIGVPLEFQQAANVRSPQIDHRPPRTARAANGSTFTVLDELPNPKSTEYAKRGCPFCVEDDQYSIAPLDCVQLQLVQVATHPVLKAASICGGRSSFIRLCSSKKLGILQSVCPAKPI